MGQNEYIEDMKCIPEIMEKDLEIVHKQFGCSQYGKIMLGQFSTSQIMSNYIHGAVNDLSPETEHCASGMSIGNNNNNLDDKKHFSNNGGNGRLVVVKTLQNDKLRSDFLHEMKSKWFISAKSERVAKLIGFLSGTNFTAMVVECGDCDLAHFLCNCDKKSIGYVSISVFLPLSLPHAPCLDWNRKPKIHFFGSENPVVKTKIPNRTIHEPVRARALGFRFIHYVLSYTSFTNTNNQSVPYFFQWKINPKSPRPFIHDVNNRKIYCS